MSNWNMHAFRIEGGLVEGGRAVPIGIDYGYGVYYLEIWAKNHDVLVLKIPGRKNWTSRVTTASYTAAEFLVLKIVRSEVGSDGLVVTGEVLVRFSIRRSANA
jgi:hypothetical protein